jgi:NADPH:quinone reductase-like Zn-dependent oxidoreductase
VYFIVEANRAQLEQIATLVDDGKLKPIIAQVFPLARAREAFEFGAASHSPGKIVLEVTPAATATEAR